MNNVLLGCNDTFGCGIINTDCDDVTSDCEDMNADRDGMTADCGNNSTGGCDIICNCDNTTASFGAMTTWL